jgi:hypothetical protein
MSVHGVTPDGHWRLARVRESWVRPGDLVVLETGFRHGFWGSHTTVSYQYVIDYYRNNLEMFWIRMISLINISFLCV